MLLGTTIKNSSFLKFVAVPQRFKMYICISFSDIMDCACTFFFTKKYSELAFLSSGEGGGGYF